MFLSATGGVVCLSVSLICVLVLELFFETPHLNLVLSKSLLSDFWSNYFPNRHNSVFILS